MSESGSLPEFPTDDATLSAIEHALGSAYEINADGEHVLVGADYSLTQLLEFMSGTVDPQDLRDEDNPALIYEGEIGGVPTWFDVRVHYSERDIIRALINEVRRLRDTIES